MYFLFVSVSTKVYLPIRRFSNLIFPSLSVCLVAIILLSSLYKSNFTPVIGFFVSSANLLTIIFAAFAFRLKLVSAVA